MVRLPRWGGNGMSLTSKLTTIAAAGAGGGENWYLAFEYNSLSDTSYTVRVDSNDDVYVGGFSYGTSSGPTSRGGFIIKFNSDGESQWEKLYYHSSDRYWIDDFDVGSDGYIYAIGYANSTVRDWTSFKIDASDGSRIATYKHSGSSIDQVYRCVWSDITNGLVAVGRSYSHPTYSTGAYWAGVNSNATISDYMQGGNYTNMFSDVCVSGTVHFYVGQTSASGSGFGFLMRTSSLTAGMSSVEFGNNCGWFACDRIGTSDAVILGQKGGVNGARVVRISHGLSEIWNKQVTVSDNSKEDVKTDSSDNIYILLRGTGGFTVVCLDSSGDLVWSNKLSNSNGNMTAYRLAISEDQQFLYVSGADAFSLTSGAGFLAKLAADGSGTGTFGDFTYAAESATVTTNSAETRRGDYLSYTGLSLSQTSQSVTTATPTYTTELTNL